MKIFFIRHGESEANVAHRINDDPSRPVNLTELGKAQAEAASDELRAVRFTHAYASEFSRAQQTAKILLRNRDCPLQIDARINERKTGMDGLPVEAFHDLMRTDPLRTRLERGRVVSRSDGAAARLHGRNRCTSPGRNDTGRVPRESDPRGTGFVGGQPRTDCTR